MTSTALAKPQSRLGALLGKVTDIIRSDEHAQAVTFGELVVQLAGCELDPKAKLPDPAAVREACDRAGKTAEQLADAVATEVTRLTLAAEVAKEPDAKESVASIREAIAKHNTEAEATITALIAKGDQLQNQLRERLREVDEAERKRTELAQIAGGPTEEEQALTEELISLTKEEQRTRNRAGLVPLLDRYIDGTLEETVDYKRLIEVTAECETLEAYLAKQPGGGMSREDFRLRKLLSERGELSRRVTASRRYFALGAEVRKVRERREEVQSKRDQYRADRLAMLG